MELYNKNIRSDVTTNSSGNKAKREQHEREKTGLAVVRTHISRCATSIRYDGVEYDDD